MGCVAITRGGAGDLWFFDNVKEAVLSPLFQLGDVYCESPADIVKMFRKSEWADLAKKIGDPVLERAIRFNEKFTKEDIKSYTHRLWEQLKVAAQCPPEDSAELVALVRRDRKMTFNTPNSYRISSWDATKERTKMDKQTETNTEAKATRTVISKDAVIHLNTDKNGTAYSAANNPKRAGSEAAKRFELYRDGMTVSEAVAAGVTRGDINWDAKQGFITLS